MCKVHDQSTVEKKNEKITIFTIQWFLKILSITNAQFHIIAWTLLFPRIPRFFFSFTVPRTRSPPPPPPPPPYPPCTRAIWFLKAPLLAPVQSDPIYHGVPLIVTDTFEKCYVPLCPFANHKSSAIWNGNLKNIYYSFLHWGITSMHSQQPKNHSTFQWCDMRVWTMQGGGGDGGRIKTVWEWEPGTASRLGLCSKNENEFLGLH